MPSWLLRFCPSDACSISRVYAIFRVSSGFFTLPSDGWNQKIQSSVGTLFGGLLCICCDDDVYVSFLFSRDVCPKSPPFRLPRDSCTQRLSLAPHLYFYLTMKLLLSVAAALSIGFASAAPAIVWKAGSSPASPSHISEQTDTRSLLSSVFDNDDSASSSSGLSAVIFLVGRDSDGSEGLVSMASSGKLPGVQAKHAHADSIHYHVDGVESSRTVAKDARLSGGMNVVEVALDEFHRKLASLAQSEQDEEESAVSVEGGKKVNKSEQKRRRAISEADVLIVSVTDKDNAAAIDSSIVKAIDSKLVRNVILSSIRSTNEVKHSRRMAVVDKITKSAQGAAARRRLQDNDQNNNNGEQQQATGVYYVNMTPNIFAGLLFFFMFVFVTHLGLSCMNMIEGQDVYVKKMPAIGREV